MCNLYSLTKGQAAIREIAGAMTDKTGNLPWLPAIFPDQSAPVVRQGDDDRELTVMRWGMPSLAFALKDRKTDPGVTNIRNLGSSHWRRQLRREHRCLVPLTSFSEYSMEPDKSRTPVWFARDEQRPLMFFAGIWTRWTSVRKVKEGEVQADLYGFLTREANATVGAVHPKAMPVILTEPEEWETWLTAPFDKARVLQRPLPDDALRIVAAGERRDGAGWSQLPKLLKPDRPIRDKAASTSFLKMHLSPAPHPAMERRKNIRFGSKAVSCHDTPCDGCGNTLIQSEKLSRSTSARASIRVAMPSTGRSSAG